MNDSPLPDIPRGDVPYTVRITILCLLIGVPVAAIVGAVLFSVNKALVPVDGKVTLSFSSFAIPLALLASGAVLAWSIFVLPVSFARRAERILDPKVWPMMGVLSLAVLLLILFVLAIIFQVI